MIAAGFGCSDVGRKREQNEDAFFVDNDMGFFVVCDGIGGEAKGEVASNMAIEVCRRILMESKDILLQFCDDEVIDSEIIEFAEILVNRINEEVYQATQADPQKEGMGTTLTMLLILGERALMAHVGDSRLYLLRNEQIHQLSDDHSFVNDLVRMGSISIDEAETHPRRNIITRSVGRRTALHIDTLLFDLLPEDKLLLCSDGVTRYLNEPEELLELVEIDNIAEVPAKLIAAANKEGGADNITAILVEIRVDREKESKSSRREEIILEHLAALKSTIPFQDLTVKERLRILNLAQGQRFDRGESVMGEKDICDDFCLILKGSISLKDKTGHAVNFEKGAFFGVESLVARHQCCATGEALEPSRILAISGTKLRAIMQERPRMGYKIIRRLSQHLLMRLAGNC